MKIVIGYLYYDLMNLYGDSGNLNVIKYQLERQGIECIIEKVSTFDEVNFDKYDMIYIGSSTEDNRDICMKHLCLYGDEFRKFVDGNKFVLVTGNSLGMFGNRLYDDDGLGIFDFDVCYGERVVREVVTRFDACDNDIYGFINTSDHISYGNVSNLFGDEGVCFNNFYGTYMIGPLLVRNYEFSLFFIKKLILSKDRKFKFKKFDFDLDKKAYFEYIEFKKSKIHIK